MYPQHLDRLSDGGSVRRIVTAGGRLARTSSQGSEVPASAPASPLGSTGVRRLRRTVLRGGSAGGTTIVLRPDGVSDAWPIAVDDDDLASAGVLSDPWPLLDVDALQRAGAETVDPEPTGPRTLTPEAFLTVMAAGSGPRHRRPSTRTRRTSLYLVAALIGTAGVGVAVASGDGASTAQADEPVSVAEQLGMVQADSPTLTGAEAADRLGAMAATRAERDAAQAAAAQVQRQADQAAVTAAAEAARPKVVLPIQGATISSGFGYRWGTLHAGLDFAAPIGTPEYAAMDGVIVRAGAASGFGLAVYIQHPNGDVTVYGHMEQILVAEGQTVKAGDTIALLGNQGQSTGPHLHFEVHKGGMDGEKVDPLPWLRDNGVQV